MRHGVDGRKFGRNTSHRVAMLKNLANNLIKQEQIVTTIEKAKETRRVAERLITLAKKGNLNSRRLAFDRTRDDAVVGKLFGELTERYKGRAGGYTRIVKVSERRWGDGAQLAMIELVDHPVLDRKRKPKAETEATSGEEAAQQATGDVFNKFKKVFAGGKKKSKAAAAAVETKSDETVKEKKTAAKKPAAKKTAKKDA